MERRLVGMLAGVSAAVVAALILVANWTIAASFGLTSDTALQFGASALPFVVAPLFGAELLRRDQPRLATAAFAVTAAVLLPPVASSALLVGETATSMWAPAAFLHFALFAALVAAATCAAQLVTDWPPRRRPTAPPAGAAVLVLVGALWSVPVAARLGDPAAVGVSLLGAVAVATVLFVAISVRGRFGATMLFVGSGSWLIEQLRTGAALRSEPVIAPLPIGWLAATGQVALLVLAVVWWHNDRAGRADSDVLAAADIG